MFKIDSHCYKCVGLPFGWAPSPGVFTKFMKQIVNALRNPINIVGDRFMIKSYNHMLVDKFMSAFIDDMLGGEQGYDKTTLFALCTIDMLHRLAVFFHLTKSIVVPTTLIKHLGFNLDVSKKLFLLTDK